MRKVLKNNYEVAHLWANQSQSEGKAYSMLFEGDTVYSWGHHWELGKIVTDKNGKRVALLQAETCSPSTAKHASIVRNAASHLPAFYVTGGRSSLYTRSASISTDHLENLKQFIDNVDKQKERLKCGRTGLTYDLERIVSSVETLLDYVERFKVPVSKLDKNYKAKFALFKKNPKQPYTKLDLELIQKFEAREKLGKEREKQILEEKGPLYEKYLKGVRYKERRTLEALHAQAILDNVKHDQAIVARAAWLEGHGDYYPSTWGAPHKLRVKGDRIETTGHAEISLNMAKKFWERFKRGSDVSGFDFGPYQAREDRAVSDGVLTVGCHHIPVTEINRIASVLGW